MLQGLGIEQTCDSGPVIGKPEAIQTGFKEVTDNFLQPDYADPTSFHLSRDTLKKPRIAVRYFVFDLKTL